MQNGNRQNWQYFVDVFLHPRILLLIPGIVVCAYAVSVLIFVQFVPDLGIKSAFSTAIREIPKSLDKEGKEKLKLEDEVVKVGNLDIKTWPDLLNAPQRIDNQFDSLSNEKETEFVRTELPNETKGRWVKVVFQRPSEGGKEITAWCRLGMLPIEERIPSLLWFALKILLFVVGVLVLWKRPRDPASVQFYLLCVFTLGAYIGGYHWFHVATYAVFVLGFIFFAVLLPAVTLHFYLVFPRPKSFLSKNKLSSLLGIYGIPCVFLALLTFLYLNLRYFYHKSGASDEVINVAQTYLRIAIYAYFLVAGILYVLCIVALIHSRRTVKDPTEKNQVKCILYGATLALFPIIYSLYMAFFQRNEFGSAGATWPMFAASVCLTAAFIISITRYRLMELDRILGTGVVYFLTSFAIGLSYYLALFLGTLIFYQVSSSPPLSETILVSSVVLIMLLLLDFVRSRFIRALDRRFHREKYHLDRTLNRMRDAIDQLIDPPTLVQRLLHASTDLLGVSRGAVYLRQRDSENFRLAGWVGPAPAQMELPKHGPLIDELKHDSVVMATQRVGSEITPAQEQLKALGGEVANALLQEDNLLAFLILGPKPTGAVYRTEDMNLLTSFSQMTTLALGSAEGHKTIELLNRELQTKVEKIAEQQRRIFALQSQLRRQGKQRSNSESTDNTVTESTNADDSQNDRTLSTEDKTGIFRHIVGSGGPVRNLLHMVGKVAPTDSVVLLRGESGTGKQLLAQAIHEASLRAGQPFVNVHSAALSAGVLESELFGHVKGAFTGAHRDKMGRFEMANGGTIFLDEIGDISLDVQIKLLRVLQERTIERVGSGEPIKVDVRIIAATHQNLEELIEQGKFREDLFYRINVFPIVVPPLRDRLEDLPELATHFLRQTSARCGKPISAVDPTVLEVLKQYEFPGNIRELENIIERAVVMAESNVIQLTDLPNDVRQQLDLNTTNSSWLESSIIRPERNGHSNTSTYTQNREKRDILEAEELVQALNEADGNKAQAARNLGLARSTFLSRLKKHGLV